MSIGDHIRDKLLAHTHGLNGFAHSQYGGVTGGHNASGAYNFATLINETNSKGDSENCPASISYLACITY